MEVSYVSTPDIKAEKKRCKSFLTTLWMHRYALA